VLQSVDSRLEVGPIHRDVLVGHGVQHALFLSVVLLDDHQQGVAQVG
jgi:hypothetical protein